jgi:hypothetical protein
VDVTPTNTITIRLIDSSAKTWSISCIGTDDASDAETVTASLVIDTTLRTATFTAPAAGSAYIFQSVVNGGIGPNQKVLTSYTTTFGIYTLTTGGSRVIAANETFEGSATHGWTKPINEALRSGLGGGNGTLNSDDFNWQQATNYPAESHLKSSDTANNTPVTVWSKTQEDESLADYSATVIARSDDDKSFALDLRATYKRTDAGAPTVVRAPAQSNPPDAGNPVGWDAVIDTSGNTVRVRFTGPASAAARASALVSVQIVKLDATVPSGFDPSTLDMTGWWRADFSGSPWTATASAGSSGTNGSLTEGTNPPSVGAAQNGLTPADFDGTNDQITAANAVTTYLTNAAGTVIVLFRADTAAADPGAAAYYNAPGLFGNTGVLHVGFADAGVRFGYYDGSSHDSVAAACATGAYHAALCRYNSTTQEVQIDSAGATGSMARGAAALDTGTAPVCGPTFAAGFYDGRILEIMTFDRRITDGEWTDIVSYFNDRYGLSL